VNETTKTRKRVNIGKKKLDKASGKFAKMMNRVKDLLVKVETLPQGSKERMIKFTTDLERIARENGSWSFTAVGSILTDDLIATSDLNLLVNYTSTEETEVNIWREFEQFMKSNFKCRLFGNPVTPLVNAQIYDEKFRLMFILPNSFSKQLSNILAAYQAIHDNIAKAFKLIKYWARARGISNIGYGYMPSYNFLLMLIYSMQVSREIALPNLQAMAAERGIERKEWVSAKLKKESGYAEEKVEADFAYLTDRVEAEEKVQDMHPEGFPSEIAILKNFFDFYTAKRVQIRVSIKSGKLPDYNRNKRNNQDLFIENPFHPKHNMAASLKPQAYTAIKQEFTRAKGCMDSGDLDDLLRRYNFKSS